MGADARRFAPHFSHVPPGRRAPSREKAPNGAPAEAASADGLAAHVAEAAAQRWKTSATLRADERDGARHLSEPPILLWVAGGQRGLAIDGKPFD